MNQEIDTTTIKANEFSNSFGEIIPHKKEVKTCLNVRKNEKVFVNLITGTESELGWFPGAIQPLVQVLVRLILEESSFKCLLSEEFEYF